MYVSIPWPQSLELEGRVVCQGLISSKRCLRPNVSASHQYEARITYQSPCCVRHARRYDGDVNGAQITGLAIGVVFFVVIGWFMLSRKRGASKISLNPLTGKFEHEQGQEPAGTTIKNAETTSGGVNATDNTGSGVELNGIKAKKDIVATNNSPPANPKV
jgi:tetrahydromethanopterin S-methyltransferase subunit F